MLHVPKKRLLKMSILLPVDRQVNRAGSTARLRGPVKNLKSEGEITMRLMGRSSALEVHQVRSANVEAPETLTRIFEEHMPALYWVTYLLTGDRNQSEQAFADALNLDQAGSTFRKFVLSWARKLVVE
jgi:hypothetical protein